MQYLITKELRKNPIGKNIIVPEVKDLKDEVFPVFIHVISNLFFFKEIFSPEQEAEVALRSLLYQYNVRF